MAPLEVTPQTAINRAFDVMVSQLQGEGLIALYLGGSILSTDHLPSSDIDFFGVVVEEFDFHEEDRLNAYLNEHIKPEIGTEVRFRGVTISELMGGPQRGNITKWVPLGVLIRRFSFFKHLWGDQFDFSSFTVERFSTRQEAKHQIARIRRDIVWFRNNQAPFPPQELAKQVLHLVAVEAEVEHCFQFDPSFEKLATHMNKHTDHIVHEAMRIRRCIKINSEELLAFCNMTEEYLANLEKGMQKWQATKQTQIRASS